MGFKPLLDICLGVVHQHSQGHRPCTWSSAVRKPVKLEKNIILTTLVMSFAVRALAKAILHYWLGRQATDVCSRTDSFQNRHHHYEHPSTQWRNSPSRTSIPLRSSNDEYAEGIICRCRLHTYFHPQTLFPSPVPKMGIIQGIEADVPYRTYFFQRRTAESATEKVLASEVQPTVGTIR